MELLLWLWKGLPIANSSSDDLETTDQQKNVEGNLDMFENLTTTHSATKVEETIVSFPPNK
jgi:hypothetical protein